MGRTGALNWTSWLSTLVSKEPRTLPASLTTLVAVHKHPRLLWYTHKIFPFSVCFLYSFFLPRFISSHFPMLNCIWHISCRAWLCPLEACYLRHHWWLYFKVLCHLQNWELYLVLNPSTLNQNQQWYKYWMRGAALYTCTVELHPAWTVTILISKATFVLHTLSAYPIMLAS